MGNPKFQKKKMRNDGFWDKLSRSKQDKKRTMDRKYARTAKRQRFL